MSKHEGTYLDRITQRRYISVMGKLNTLYASSIICYFQIGNDFIRGVSGGERNDEQT